MLANTFKWTWAEEDQAGLQSLQLNLRLEVMDLHGAEDLTHGHVRLVQTGCPAGTEKQSERKYECYCFSTFWENTGARKQAFCQSSPQCVCFVFPPHLFFSFIVTRFSKSNRTIIEWRLFVPTFPGRAGWAVCRRWWRLQPRSSVSSSSPLGWRGGRWTAAESTFYLQTEPTFTVRANRTVFRKELNLQIIR